MPSYGLTWMSTFSSVYYQPVALRFGSGQFTGIMHSSILRVTIPPPGQPRGQVQPFRPGGGELFEAVLSREEGAGANKNRTSCCSCKVRHFSADTMAPDRAEKIAYFRGKSLEFVADWLKKNKLSKLKSVFEGTFIIISC